MFGAQFGPITMTLRSSTLLDGEIKKAVCLRFINSALFKQTLQKTYIYILLKKEIFLSIEISLIESFFHTLSIAYFFLHFPSFNRVKVCYRPKTLTET